MMAGSLWRTLPTSNGSYGEEYDRTNHNSTSHSIESDDKLRKEVKALNEKLDKHILAQSTMKKVNFVSAEEMVHVQEGEDTQFAELDRVEAWPVELRNSTGWSSRWSSWLQDGFLLHPLRIRLSCVHAPSPSLLLTSHMLQSAPKDLFQGSNMHMYANAT
ncbi:unnamed protein product [Microthlaspi erraticum]|uniref:Uncharacterized protein n=1 Tax=Microthlaspi erraticum TaxID=1685480 RepID=A0A6D2IPT6_9BRAS|nr:unnamed protein product [Microthlaspi erraticum]